VNAQLYDEAIKALARAAHGAGTLRTADAVVRLDNPYCGDRIDLALTLDTGRVVTMTHETKGCLLCCASASLIGLRAPGATIAQVEQAVVALDALLAGRDLPAGAWAELEVFRPVRDYPARFGCVTLPLNALRKAVELATKQKR
jgi:NifU-like protein involved in Fe-S cluster formation